MALFPEGTRNGIAKGEKVKDGAAFFAVRSGAPVIPCGIKGGEKGNKKVTITYGKPLDFSEYKGSKDKEVLDKITDEIIITSEECKKKANNLHLGDTVNGIVKSIKPYGAFIEIEGGIVGLVHIKDLSVARIKTPFERLQIGQKINIKIKNIDKETGKISLSYKEMFGTWEENAKNFQVGMKTKGIVRETEKDKNGIFVELKPNLVGMIEYKDGLEYGQDINVAIKKIDYEKKKIKLAYY